MTERVAMIASEQSPTLSGIWSPTVDTGVTV
jgi:hypothetical protein